MAGQLHAVQQTRARGTGARQCSGGPIGELDQSLVERQGEEYSTRVSCDPEVRWESRSARWQVLCPAGLAPVQAASLARVGPQGCTMHLHGGPHRTGSPPLGLAAGSRQGVQLVSTDALHLTGPLQPLPVETAHGVD
jgi:hypothetical protein